MSAVALAEGPMPDLSYRDQCPTRHDFAEALAEQIVNDAIPDWTEFGDDGYSHPAYLRARRNAMALMAGALHIASQVHDNYPGQDLGSMVVFERWLSGHTGLRVLQRMRAHQLGVRPTITLAVSTENA